MTVNTTSSTIGSSPKSLECSTRCECAKKTPATPAKKAPSTKAPSLYRGTFTPSVSASSSPWRMAPLTSPKREQWMGRRDLDEPRRTAQVIDEEVVEDEAQDLEEGEADEKVVWSADPQGHAPDRYR